MKTRFSSIRRILFVILLLNWAVAAAKIFYGIFSDTDSMRADGFHSLSDGVSNIIGLIGIAVAAQPPDKNHPYGHRKYETFFSLAIAALLLYVAGSLVQQGVERFRQHTAPEVGIISFLVMLVTIAVNIWVMRYEYREGKRLQSDILVSDSLHTRADLFTSISVVAALVCIKLGFIILDPIVTVMIAGFIAYAAFPIIRDSARVLCDTVPVESEKIAAIVLSVKGVKACHKIRTRGREDDVHVDLHALVAPDMHVDKAHAISFEIETLLKEKIAGVTDVVVHLEPKRARENGKR